jgi:hypothetical protein
MEGVYGTLGKKKNAYRVLMEKLCEEEHLEVIAFDGQIILTCVF